MKLLTTTETAKILRINIGTLRNRISQCEDMPTSILIGRRRLFPQAALEAWLDKKLAHAIQSDTHIADKHCQRGRPKGKERKNV